MILFYQIHAEKFILIRTFSFKKITESITFKIQKLYGRVFFNFPYHMLNKLIMFGKECSTDQPICIFVHSEYLVRICMIISVRSRTFLLEFETNF